ncbi:putative RNA-directed DNA polymerase from transposon BS [Trichonephila clavipes]|nr:putative RNA-directed DNA polymerase from transposon BS [Trichonephila clavipes]
MTGTLPPHLGGVEACQDEVLLTAMDPNFLCPALQGIGEPKSVKKMHSSDLLVKTTFTIQSKSYLDSPLLVTPHKSLNSSRFVISEPDLLCTSEAKILEGFSNQGLIQIRRITLKKLPLFLENI